MPLLLPPLLLLLLLPGVGAGREGGARLGVAAGAGEPAAAPAAAAAAAAVGDPATSTRGASVGLAGPSTANADETALEGVGDAAGVPCAGVPPTLPPPLLLAALPSGYGPSVTAWLSLTLEPPPTTTSTSEPLADAWCVRGGREGDWKKLALTGRLVLPVLAVAPLPSASNPVEPVAASDATSGLGDATAARALASDEGCGEAKPMSRVKA